MDFELNKGIIKKNVEGNIYPWILKDFETGAEFEMSNDAMKIHGMNEGDIVEFSGSIQGDTTYLAISQIEVRMNLN